MNYPILFREAYKYARSTSTDLSTQNAALLVDPLTCVIVARGANKFINPQYGTEEDHDRPRKYVITEHAERDAIYASARGGIKTEGLFMICPWAACADCARAIVAAGVLVLVRSQRMLDASPERWLDAIEAGDEIMADAGIIIHNWTGKVGQIEILFNGKQWEC